jgi:glycerol-3-phosphate dehydrogenase
MDRDTSLNRLGNRDGPWDMAVIGGGATGVGIAVDAASRGYSVCLVEQSDFGKGTSSRSTKLIHGGVRYLQQGNVSLVMEALKERGILRQNAPHLVHDLAFVVPNYAWWEAPFYGLGLKVYDLLAFRYGFGRSRHLGKDEVLARIPNLEPTGLRGGVVYHDGQFDDARLLIHLAETAVRHGAVLLNYARVDGLTHDAQGHIDGLTFNDLETDRQHTLRARCVINATGAFCDSIRTMDDPTARPIIAPSQGVHLVLDGSFLSGNTAVVVPRTADGRVLFAIPWHGHTLLGTTDTPIRNVSLEPLAQEEEIDYILGTTSRYLARRPTRDDILSVFAGIRPLVNSSATTNTAALSREHTITVSRSRLLTIAGGKWTTYRKMAEDCVNHAARLANLPRSPCVTKTLKIHGPDESGLRELITTTPELARQLHPALPILAVQVVWAMRHEMARTVEDVLSRRTRALMLNANAAVSMAPAVAQLMATELGHDETWQHSQVAQLTTLAQGYRLVSRNSPSR